MLLPENVQRVQDRVPLAAVTNCPAPVGPNETAGLRLCCAMLRVAKPQRRPAMPACLRLAAFGLAAWEKIDVCIFSQFSDVSAIRFLFVDR